jgi:SNF2 family DNA or RNA helicase
VTRTFELQKARWARAERVKKLDKVDLPHLADWNYGPCEHHEVSTAECEYRKCGFTPFDHQTVSAAVHFISHRSIDASETGTGKTNSILLTLCLVKHYNERLKAILVVPTTAVQQWASETERFAPGLKIATATAGMKKDQRIELYAQDWEVLIIGFHLMTRDIDALEELHPSQVVSDDVDPLLQLTNKTHQSLVRLSSDADRIIIANATNLQTRLDQLYAVSIPLGSREIWGSIKSFKDKYIKKDPVTVFYKSSSGVRTKNTTLKATGYKNLDDFKAKFNQMVIRHRYEDLSDVRIPSIIAESVYLELYAPQRYKYDLLQQGVLELMKKDEPPQQKMVSALAAWTHGGQICAGLPALNEADGPQASVKLDWTVRHITNDWADRKTVVYARNQGTIRALQDRLDSENVGHAAIWGGLTGADKRAAERKRFLEDNDCRTMIISAAGERSLNLQNASVLTSIDTNLNPARVQQIMGRIRRIGSVHDRVFAFSLLAIDTQEDRYQTVLASRQALFDAVHDENHADLFEQLDAETLLRLISP